MNEININLLNPKKILHDQVLDQYLRAKKAMDGVPTAEKLKKLISTTAQLSMIREEMEKEFPEA